MDETQRRTAETCSDASLVRVLAVSVVVSGAAVLDLSTWIPVAAAGTVVGTRHLLPHVQIQPDATDRAPGGHALETWNRTRFPTATLVGVDFVKSTSASSSISCDTVARGSSSIDRAWLNHEAKTYGGNDSASASLFVSSQR